MSSHASSAALTGLKTTPDIKKKHFFPLSLVGVGVFKNFLKSEFSEENIDFWVACEEYKKTSGPKLATRARQIYQQFVEPDAPHEVISNAMKTENK